MGQSAMFCPLPWPGQVGPMSQQWEMTRLQASLLIVVSPLVNTEISCETQDVGQRVLAPVSPTIPGPGLAVPSPVSPLLPKLLTATAPAPLTQPP